MKKKIGFGWAIIGIIPYALTLIMSIIAMFNGINTCLVIASYTICDYVFGLKAFGQVWYMLLNIWFPLYLAFMFFMILGFSGEDKMTSFKRNKLLLLFGIAPFGLSLCLFLFSCLANAGYPISALFEDIFMNHIFIVGSDFIGIVLILLGINGLQKEEQKSKKNKKK